jgi:hypothetical protein
VGSLHAGDTLLTTAFKEQYSTIGWYQLLLGCRSGKWGKAYAAYVGRSCTMQQQTSWSSLLVTLLWKYTRSLWQYRNKIIHGSTAEASAKHKLIQLQTEVTRLYSIFNLNPNFILPRHCYLFQHKSFLQRLSQPYNDIQCWLRCFTEAQNILHHQETILHVESRRAFYPSDASSSYTPSAPSTDTSTTLTITTTSIMSPPSLSRSTSLESLATSQTAITHPSSNGTTLPPSVISWTDAIT